MDGNYKSMNQTNQIVDHFFRKEYGKMMAIFTNKYGSHQIETIEDSIHDTLIKAMQVWPFKNIPDNPSAWIFRSANNSIIDKLRRASKTTDDAIEEILIGETEVMKLPNEDDIEDDQLKMMFACCHPSMSEESQIILTLKLLCGFGVSEIARALLKKEETIAKAITRGKKKFKTEIGELKVPENKDLGPRLKVVSKVIYLIFTEGYKVTKGSQLIDKEIAIEAIRLALLLITNKHCNTKEINALTALMYFHIARFDARIDEQGRLLTMKEQDRSLWDKELIAIGHQYLNAAANATYLTSYHLQAQISGFHCIAKTFEATNWQAILYCYDLQVKGNRLPIAEMNRIVPFSKVYGIEAGLKELENLSRYKILLSHHLYYAIKADLLIEQNNWMAATNALRKSIELSNNIVERDYLKQKLKNIEYKLH